MFNLDNSLCVVREGLLGTHRKGTGIRTGYKSPRDTIIRYYIIDILL